MKTSELVGRCETVSKKLHNATTAEEKELLTKEFWWLAKEAFESADDDTASGGFVIYLPPAEL